MNRELFSKILDRIKADPETWNQKAWACRKPDCGTAYCFAGHIAADMGFRVKDTGGCFDRDGHYAGYVADIAREALDITEDEDEWLFAQSRTLADFERVREFGSVEAAKFGSVEDEIYDGDDE